MGAVDADEHKQLGGRYGVRGFPTIKIFGADKNKPSDYQGDLLCLCSYGSILKNLFFYCAILLSERPAISANWAPSLHFSLSLFLSLSLSLPPPGQRTAEAIVEESLRVTRQVVQERMGGKKSSGVS